MPKDFSLSNLLRDLEYTVNGTYVHTFLFHLCPPEPGMLVLEPGCGSGKFGLSYSLRGAEVILFDIDPQVVDYCKRIRDALEALTGGALPVKVHEGDIFRHDYGENNFHLVFNEGVPQHWQDEERRQGCIDRMARWARPGGLVVIVGNNGLNLHEQEIDRVFQFKYEGMPPQRKCFTPSELGERMERTGLVEVQVVPLDGGIQQATLLAGWGRKEGK